MIIGIIYVKAELETNPEITVRTNSSIQVIICCFVIVKRLNKLQEIVAAKLNRTYAKRQHWLLRLQI